MKQVFLVLSIVLSLLSFLVGIISIIKGKFKPQRMSRFLLFLITLLLVFSLIAQGDRNAVWLALAMMTGSLSIFLLSIKKGLGGRSVLDIVVFFMVLISLVIWYTTKNPLLALIMSIITDLIAFSPTMVKAWFLPKTEDWKFYAIDGIAGFLNLLSLSIFTFGKVIYPIYVLFGNGLLVLLITIKRRHSENC